MPISMQELNRIVKLHGIIEGHKEHSHAAPTYKDSPYLAEMAQIALAPRDHDIETLEEIIPTLWYLTECYDKMCRAGMSVKFYTLQLQAHTELMKLREYDIEDMEGFENCFIWRSKQEIIMNLTIAPTLSQSCPVAFQMKEFVNCFSQRRKTDWDSSKTIPLRKRRNILL